LGETVLKQGDSVHSFTGDPPAAAQTGALPDRRELALVAVERTRMPMVVSDARQPDNPIVLANQAFLDLTGYSADEVIGRNCRFLQGPGTASEAVDAIRRGLAAEEHFITVELLNYRKDGSAFWNQLAISPVHDHQGRTVYYFASQNDVSARRRAEELEATERLLLMEVDHRAMNALALVQSILSLTQADDVKRYSSAVTGRIGAIAEVHRLLASSNWRGARIDQLIRPDAPRSRIQTHGPPATLAPRLAQPLAIVFNELLSNSIQHGSLLTADGWVDLSWTIKPDQLAVKWREQGGVTPQAPAAMGLGLDLVRSIVERQLGGAATLSWADPFEVRLFLPMGHEEVYD
jgi:PAS domain S-box-containing protein